MTSEAFGVLSIKIPNAHSGDVKKGCYVRLEFDEGLCDPQNYECPKVDDLNFKYNLDVPLKTALDTGNKVTVNIMEHHTLKSNSSLGVAKIQLDPLTLGNAVGPEDFECKDQKQETKYKLNVTISWKDGSVPDSVTNAGSAAAGNLTKPLGGKPGEKVLPLPECENNDYSVRVKVHRLKNLQSIVPDKLYDPRCIITVGTKTYKTEVVKKSMEPTFDEECAFNFEKVKSTFWTELLSINVVNDRFALPDEQVGSVALDVGSIYRSNRQHALIRKWFVILRAQGDGTVMGYAKLSISVLNLRTDNLVEFEDDGKDEDEKDEDITQNLINTTGAAYETIYLHIDIIKASGLPKMDSDFLGKEGKCDPYVKLIFGKNNVETCWHPDTFTPEWKTRLMLPVMLPCLASTLKMELWDHDKLSADDIIGTHLLDINDMMAGRKDNLPALAARYINMYGHPRSNDADFSRYFKEMARGHKKGLDYRGRVLLRIIGMRSKILPPLPEVKESTVEVDVFVEVLQLSQLPKNDKYKIKAMCGIGGDVTQVYESQPMKDLHGKDFENQHAIYVGELIKFTVKFPVVLPSREDLIASQLDEKSTFEDVDPNSLHSFSTLSSEREAVAALEKVIWEQVPALVVHLITDSAVEKFIEKVTGSKDEEPTAAVVFQPQRFFNAGGSFVTSKAMRLMSDPDKLKAGKMPTNPLVQLNCGMLMRRINPIPETQVPLAQGPPKYILGEGRMRTYILSVFVYHARNVPPGDDNGLSDAYTVVTWGNAGAKTGVRKETLNPTFNEALYLESHVKEPLPDIVIELWDWDMIGSNTFLGKAYLDLADVHGEGPFWIKKFTDQFGKKMESTELLVALKLEAATEERRREVRSRGQVQMKMHRDSSRTYKGYPIPTNKRLPMAQYVFDCRVFGLRHMRKYHLKDITSPEIEFECYDNSTTSDRKSGRNADFDQELSWVISLPSNEAFLPYMNIYVFDYRLGLRVLVAVAQVRLSDPMLKIENKNKKKKADDNHVQANLHGIKEWQIKQIEVEANSSTTTPAAGGDYFEGNHEKPKENKDHASLSFGNLSLAVSALNTGSPTKPSATAAAAAASGGEGAGPEGNSGEGEGDDNNKKKKPQQKEPEKMTTKEEVEKSKKEENNNNKKKKSTEPVTGTTPNQGGTESSAEIPQTKIDELATKKIQQFEQEGQEAIVPEGDEEELTEEQKEERERRRKEDEEMRELLARPSTVSAAREMDQRIKDAVEDIARELEEPSENTSIVSTEPDELLWYDRFDPASADNNDGEALSIPFERRVARFGKCAPRIQSLGAGRTEAEHVFGGFDDQYSGVQLYRGWGESGSKAGVVNLDMSFTKLSKSKKSASSAATAAAGGGDADVSRKADANWKASKARKRTPFLARVYILQCKELTAMDSGIFGNSSDPYCILTLTGNPGSSSKEDVVVNCRDQTRYQVLDPEFFFVRELSGELPKHAYLRVTVLDWDRFSVNDDVIGFTDINLEERYYSCRGYSRASINPTLNCPPDMDDPAAFYGLHHYGSYTEKRMVRDESGLAAGTIEMWVDFFDYSVPVPRPIDIAPPPPIPLELRVVVWNVRDCELTDEAITGELMTDIYVKCWMDGMSANEQNTDIHYRSLDGSGCFNWRMNFPLTFDPRKKKVFPASEDAGSEKGGDGKESGGAASTAKKSSIFGVRKEAKKLRPRLMVNLWDSDIMPMSDDYIGMANLNLLSLVPAFSRRVQSGLFQDVHNDCKHCCQTFPCSMCCGRLKCCTPQKGKEEFSLSEKQQFARDEMKIERAARDTQIKKDVREKMAALENSDKFPPEELKRVKARLYRQAKKSTKINAFKEFLPQRRKKSQLEEADKAYAEDVGKKLAIHGDDPTAIANKATEEQKPEVVAEIPRQWYICRGPSGGTRVGDVQLSFQLVRLDALKKDEKLAAGKGRSEPQQLPEPERPDSSFFWLSSPFKSAIHILWKNYKYYIITTACLAIAGVLIYIFFAEALGQQARDVFAG